MVVGTSLRQGVQRGSLCDLKLELTLQMLIGVKGGEQREQQEQIPSKSLGRWQEPDPGGRECRDQAGCS